LVVCLLLPADTETIPKEKYRAVLNLLDAILSMMERAGYCSISG